MSFSHITGNQHPESPPSPPTVLISPKSVAQNLIQGGCGTYLDTAKTDLSFTSTNQSSVHLEASPLTSNRLSIKRVVTMTTSNENTDAARAPASDRSDEYRHQGAIKSKPVAAVGSIADGQFDDAEDDGENAGVYSNSRPQLQAGTTVATSVNVGLTYQQQLQQTELQRRMQLQLQQHQAQKQALPKESPMCTFVAPAVVVPKMLSSKKRKANGIQTAPPAAKAKTMAREVTPPNESPLDALASICCATKKTPHVKSCTTNAHRTSASIQPQALPVPSIQTQAVLIPASTRRAAPANDALNGITTANISKVAHEISVHPPHNAETASGSGHAAPPRTTPGGSAAVHLTENDVLCGRGGMTNHHPGNVRFRQLVRQLQPAYLRASKREKSGIARLVVDTIRTQLQPSGRFLKKRDGVEGWFDIGDQKAREKTSQALREGAPDIRDEVIGGGSKQQLLPAPSGRLPAEESITPPTTFAGKVAQEVVQAPTTPMPTCVPPPLAGDQHQLHQGNVEEQPYRKPYGGKSPEVCAPAHGGDAGDKSGRCSPRGPRLALLKQRVTEVEATAH